MHIKSTAELVLETLPNGQPAWLRPSTVDRYRLNPDRVVIVDQVESATPPEPFIPRDELPEWVFETRTHFLVWAPTAERAQRWFVDESDTDVDTEILTFGRVDLLGQTVRSMDHDPEPRYVVTDAGRRALAEYALFGPCQTVAAQWNEDGEQYRVIVMDQLAATFTDSDAAYDFYTENVCQHCRTNKSMHDGRCCDVQTWTRS